MPTYQYTCTECEHDLEAMQKFTDDPLTECPQCQGRLRKVFSAVGVVFKGSGFYRNDSRAKSSSAETSSSTKGSDSGPSSKDSAPKSDAAPTKSESPSKTSKSSESAA